MGISFNTVVKRINNLKTAEVEFGDMERKLTNDPEYQLVEPQGLMTAKSYKTKFAEPLVKKLKSVIKSLLLSYFKVLDNYHRINQNNGKLYKENEYLEKRNGRLTEENSLLREQNKDYALLRKVFGNQQIDALLEQAKEMQQSKQRQRRLKNHSYER